MNRIHPKCLDPETGDGSAAADGLFTGDSEEEEDDEEEEDGKDDEENTEEDEDEGYSE